MVTNRGYALSMLALAAALFVAGSATAFGQEAPPQQDRINQLESQLNAQAAQIQALREQLAAQQTAGVEQMRVEEIKNVVRELFRDPEFRDQLPLNAGYDNGFFIRSGQDFLLKINGLMQARYTLYGQSGRAGETQSDRSGLGFNRLRIGFSGYAWDPNFTYRFELKADDTEDVSMEYAWVNYKFADPAQMRIGLFNLPFGRQETVSVAGLQFVDRSLANAVFNAGRSMAVMLHGAVLDRRVEYGVALSNGIRTDLDGVEDEDANGRAFLDTNPALTARAVWHAMYDQLGKDFADESDLAYHKKPALDLGTSFAWSGNEGDRRNFSVPFAIPESIRAPRQGGFGLLDGFGTDELEIVQWGADAAFKYLGFSLTGEYFLRMIDVDSNNAPLALLTDRTDSSHQQGGYVQAGYFIVPNKLEAVARVGGIWDFDGDGLWEYTGGVNYYIRGHNLKIQADVTSINELPVVSSSNEFLGLNDDIVMFRLQLQAAF